MGGGGRGRVREGRGERRRATEGGREKFDSGRGRVREGRGERRRAIEGGREKFDSGRGRVREGRGERRRATEGGREKFDCGRGRVRDKRDTESCYRYLPNSPSYIIITLTESEHYNRVVGTQVYFLHWVWCIHSLLACCYSLLPRIRVS